MGLYAAVNYLLLRGAAIVSGVRTKNSRITFGVLIGGVYGGLCVVYGESAAAANTVRFLVLALTGIISFGLHRQSIRAALLLIILNLTLDGITELTHKTDSISLIIASGIIAVICRFLRFDSISEKRFTQIVINHRGKAVALNAFHDTGNSLMDPITGERMVVIGPRAACALTGLTKEELASPITTLCQGRIRGLRIVPFSSVGNENGLMLAMRFSDVRVDGKPANIVAAFAAEGMNEYDALMGG